MAYYSYSVVTTNATKNDYQTAMATFFSQLTTQLFYLNYAKSFYVYALSSQYFRKIFVERILKIFHQFSPHRMNTSRIHRSNLDRQPNIMMHTMHVQALSKRRYNEQKF